MISTPRFFLSSEWTFATKFPFSRAFYLHTNFSFFFFTLISKVTQIPLYIDKTEFESLKYNSTNKNQYNCSFTFLIYHSSQNFPVNSKNIFYSLHHRGGQFPTNSPSFSLIQGQIEPNSPRVRVHIDAENRKRAMCVETQVSPAHFIEGFLCICCADTRGEKRAVIKCTLQLNFRRERKKAILTLEERGRRKYGKGRQEGHGAAQRRWVFV